MQLSPERVGLWLILWVTAARVIALAFDRTDLFVDEAQYWLWGQHLDFGYYSKPPLIGWVIRAVTDIIGSDTAFWVRFPAPIFHCATALILMGFASDLAGKRAGAAVGIAYVLLPIVAVGSYLISTDTILAPFFAGALWAFCRALKGGMGAAALSGALLGAAFMAKYAAVYFLMGLVLVMIWPKARLTGRQHGAFFAAFAVMIAPNVIWNFANDLTTVTHTMDNIEWVRPEGASRVGGWSGALEFFGAQFAVFGPIFLAILFALPFLRPQGAERWLILFALPPILAITLQGGLAKAYANWAFPAYLAGTVVVILWMARRQMWRTFWVAVGLNALASVAVPVLIAAPEWIKRSDGVPIMVRYLGRHELGEAILSYADDNGVETLIAENRDLLAELFYSGRDSDLRIRSTRPVGAPENFYAQNFAEGVDEPGPILVVTTREPEAPDFSPDDPLGGSPCPVEVITFDSRPGSFDGVTFYGTIIPAECLG